jgi:hypothetical protein
VATILIWCVGFQPPAGDRFDRTPAALVVDEFMSVPAPDIYAS